MEIETTVEHLHHAGHGEGSRFKTVVTLLIVIATAAAACVGYLGVRANTHAEESGRDRQLQVVLSQQEDDRVSSLQASSDQANSDSDDYYTRSLAYQIQSDKLADSNPDASQVLSDTSDRLNARGDVIDKNDHSADPAYFAKQSRKGNEAEQRSIKLGETTEKWVQKEDIYTGVIGIIAVALFLFGLALTVQSVRIRLGFVVLAALLAVVGAARAAVTETAAIPALNPAALTAYLDGVQDGDSDKAEASIADFRKSVAIDPEYSEAWTKLGLALTDRAQNDDKGADEDIKASVEAYRKAIETGAKDAELRNNLAFAELETGDLSGATTDIAVANQLDPDDPFVLGTEAEIALAKKDPATATALSEKSLELVAHVDGDYRNAFLTGQAADGQTMTDRKIGNPADVTAYFARVLDAQTSLDAFGTATPRDSHGAKLTDLTLDFDSDNQRLKFSAKEHGAKAGDVVSVRVYSDGDYQSDLSTQQLAVKGTGSVDVKGDSPLYEGSYHVEVFLNGHFQLEDDLDAKNSS